MLLNHLLCIVSAFFLLFCKFVGSAELLVVGRFTSGLYTGKKAGVVVILVTAGMSCMAFCVLRGDGSPSSVSLSLPFPSSTSSPPLSYFSPPSPLLFPSTSFSSISY